MGNGYLDFLSIHGKTLCHIKSELPMSLYKNVWSNVSVPIDPLFTPDADFQKLR